MCIIYNAGVSTKKSVRTYGLFFFWYGMVFEWCTISEYHTMRIMFGFFFIYLFICQIRNLSKTCFWKDNFHSQKIFATFLYRHLCFFFLPTKQISITPYTFMNWKFRFFFSSLLNYKACAKLSMKYVKSIPWIFSYLRHIRKYNFLWKWYTS